VKNLRHGWLSLCYAALILVGNTAIAQSPTTTHLRCFYRLDPSNLQPDTAWVWAIDAATIERAKDPNFNREEFLRAFNQAHPTGPDPRPSPKDVMKWDPAQTDFPHKPYVNLAQNDPAALQQDLDTGIENLAGYWYSRPDLLANVFYSQTSQQDLVNICNLSLTLQGKPLPVAMYSAASDYLSYDYMIWTVDPANQDGKINKIVSFGDSVSDIQNMFNGTYWWIPTQHNYFIGRFSNGKNWLDYLSVKVNLPVYDWAIGGAASQSVYHGLLRGVIYQVNSFIAYTQLPQYAKNYEPEHTLFTVLIGANDLISYGLTADQIYNNVVLALSNLIANGGARNIMVVKLPDLSLTPTFKLPSQQGRKEYIHSQVLEYNKRLDNLVTDIFNSPLLLHSENRIAPNEVNIQIYDAFKLINNFIDHPGKYGIGNTTDSCLDLDSDSILNYALPQVPRFECQHAVNQADSFLFWDLLHPTTHTHKLLAEYAYCFIEKKFGDMLEVKRQCTMSDAD
jgi:thermolabile hemolysin